MKYNTVYTSITANVRNACVSKHGILMKADAKICNSQSKPITVFSGNNREVALRIHSSCDIMYKVYIGSSQTEFKYGGESVLLGITGLHLIDIDCFSRKDCQVFFFSSKMPSPERLHIL